MFDRAPMRDSHSAPPLCDAPGYSAHGAGLERGADGPERRFYRCKERIGTSQRIYLGVGRDDLSRPGGTAATAESASGMIGGSGALSASVVCFSTGCSRLSEDHLPSARTTSRSVRGVAAVA